MRVLGLLCFTLLFCNVTAQSTFELKNCRNNSACRVDIDSGIQVFVFLSPECPLCQKYPLTLNKLYQATKGYSEWRAIVPGKNYSSKEVNDFCAEFGLEVPVYIDKAYKLTKRLKASITPQVVVLKNSKVQYTGKIDDWPIELGKMRPVVRNKYLEEALNAVLTGESPDSDYTEPIGCFIF